MVKTKKNCPATDNCSTTISRVPRLDLYGDVYKGIFFHESLQDTQPSEIIATLKFSEWSFIILTSKITLYNN